MGKPIHGKGNPRRRLVKPHVSKYAHLAPAPQSKPYNRDDKTFRTLPVQGMAGDVVPKGLRIVFHGRHYELTEDVCIPESGRASGQFRLIQR